jgi:hypothetical protein
MRRHKPKKHPPPRADETAPAGSPVTGRSDACPDAAFHRPRLLGDEAKEHAAWPLRVSRRTQ